MPRPERPPVGVSGVREAVKSADSRVALEAIRDALAEAIEAAAPNEVAALSKQLVDVLGRIESLPTKEASAVDDLAAKRAARKARPSHPSADGGQRRTGGDSPSG